jgi:chromosome segregation ATPase
MSRRAQATTNISSANTNVTPQNKRMSIDGALKIMWNKITELDNEIRSLKGETIPEASEKTVPVASQQTAPKASQNQKITSTQPTLAPETEIRNNITQIKRVIETQEKRIKHLETQFGRFTQDIMKTTGSVKTDMETRYSQLNNFLVELQTTQMVMNDKVLKQFNDVVEKNAEEKFKNATTQVEDAEEQVTEEQITEGEEQIAEVEEQIAEGEEQIVQEVVQEAEEQIAEGEEQIAEGEEQIAEGEEQIVQEVAQEAAQEVADEVAEKLEQQIAEGEEQTTEEQQTKENITLDVV